MFSAKVEPQERQEITLKAEPELNLIWADTRIPPSRALDNFSVTETGDGEIVLFDNERLTYHTLNRPAFAVWQFCDGGRTCSEIAAAINEQGLPIAVQAVELAVIDLTEAGLMSADIPSPTALMSRRRLVKLAVVGTVGVAVVPVVSSITAPSVLANHTCGANGTVPPGGHCVCDSECGAGNCCCGTSSSSTPRTCGDRAGQSSNCSGGPQVCIA